MEDDAKGAEEQGLPDQHTAATTPALRGPARSTQPPQTAAATPRTNMNRVKIQFRSATSQSQLVVKSTFQMLEPAGQLSGLPPPTARDNGSQKTLKPYAIPMHKWIANAAGGTNHRLYVAAATVRSRSNSPGAELLRPVERCWHSWCSPCYFFVVVRSEAGVMCGPRVAPPPLAPIDRVRHPPPPSAPRSLGASVDPRISADGR